MINKVTKPAREGPNKQSYLKFLTNKMAQIFIILYLIPDTVRWAVESWERRRAENQREAEAALLEPSAVVCWADENRLNSGDWRVERKVKFLGFWVDLFVLIWSEMALRGVWQLQKLVVSYSDWGGSSRGIRYALYIYTRMY